MRYNKPQKQGANDEQKNIIIKFKSHCLQRKNMEIH